MFELMTYDNIIADMMAEAPNDLDTREGSLFYNACSRQALQLEQAYIQMDLILDNMIIDTMDEFHLTEYGKGRGIIRNDAVSAIVKGEFSQHIEIGERFNLNQYNYIVLANLGGFTYSLECETPGDAPNSNLGEIEPIQYIDEWAGGRITEIITPGVAIEPLETYRTRVKASFNTKSFGGNRAQYKEYMNSLPYVGGTKVKRRIAGEEYINIYFQSDSFGVPLSGTVDEAQSTIDPTVNSGEGYGMAPICHKVKIHPVIGVKVNVDTKITFDDGFTFENMKDQITSVIDEYLLELNKTWEDSDSLTVRIARIESKILTLDGVVDISETKINGLAQNLTIDEFSVCERGEVNAIQ